VADNPSAASSGIADLCSNVFSLAFSLQKEAEKSDAETIYLKFDHAFAELDTKAQRADIPLDNVRLAKYALAAFIDEKVLTSNLAIKDAWSSKPLQLKYFDDFSAGEEFYNKLELLRHTTSPGKIDALEVYYLCLALGFKGKYGDKRGEERRMILMDQIKTEIYSARGNDGSVLSPQWNAPAAVQATAGAGDGRRKLPLWLMPTAALALVVVVYVISTLLLGSALGDFSTLVK